MQKSKGIVLLSHGKRGYGFAAFNLALSIKKFNPHISIALLHDGNSISQLSEFQKKQFFDYLIPVDVNGLNAGEIKASIYDYLPFDYNLYLDVDSIALRDVSFILDDLIALGGNYYTHVNNVFKLSEVDSKVMYWANPDDIIEKYKLKESDWLPATNSSIQFIKKCKESKALFKQFKDNILNPIPLDKLLTKWGNTQPDELYLNIALLQKGINADPNKKFVFLGNENTNAEFSEITKDFPLFTFFGGKGYTKLKYTEWYDRLMHIYCQHFGYSHDFKIRLIIQDKHLNNRW